MIDGAAIGFSVGSRDAGFAGGLHGLPDRRRSNVLILEAYDVSFAKLNEPLPLLGRAIFVPDVNSVISGPFPLPNPAQPIPAATTTIAQHRRQVAATPPPNNFTYQLISVATAAIVITPPNPDLTAPTWF